MFYLCLEYQLRIVLNEERPYGKLLNLSRNDNFKNNFCSFVISKLHVIVMEILHIERMQNQ